MYRRDLELVKRYSLVLEGIKDIQQMLQAYQNENWYDDAYNTFSIRNKEAVLVLRRDDLAAVVPQSWSSNEAEKPLFTDNDAKHCINWLKSGTSANDILMKYIDYKRLNLQQVSPTTQFQDFAQFDTFVDAQKRQRDDNAKSKQANSAATWEPQDIIFENDDVVILNGSDRYANIRIRAVLSKRTGLNYTFCISNPTLATNYYDTYRFKPGGSSQSFYWLFFKNIPTSDRFHICVLGVCKDGSYQWSLRDNATADVTWNNFVDKYKSYGIDFDKPLVSPNKTVDNVHEFLKYNELTPSEKEDRDLRDFIVNKLRISYQTNTYEVEALQNILTNYNTEFTRKLLGDALEVKYINNLVWAVLSDYCRNVIINRVPPEILREDLVVSPEFKNDTKLLHRYSEMLTRSVKYLPNYLLQLMNDEQTKRQTITVWQHQKDVQLKALNVPVYYPSHFDAGLLALYLSRAAIESGFVKRPENWPNVAPESRAKLFHMLNTSVNKHTEINEHIAEQALHIFINFEHLG